MVKHKRSMKRRSMKRRSIKRRSMKRRSLKKRGGNMPITLEEQQRVMSQFVAQQNKVELALAANQKRLQPIIDLYEIVLKNPNIFLPNNRFRQILFEKMTAIEKNKNVYAYDAGNENILHQFDSVNTELKKLVNQYEQLYNDNNMDLFQL